MRFRTDEENYRQRIWTSLMRLHAGVSGARTQHISAIDANGHVGRGEEPADLLILKHQP